MQKQRFPQKVQQLRESDRLEELEIERVIKLCAPGNGCKNVLDIGTGSGLFAEAFSSSALCVAGIDSDPEMAGFLHIDIFQPRHSLLYRMDL